jgi:polysaccharide export outer membrane protein
MPAGQNYIIGPGDVIDMSIWKDEALRGQMIVLPDGTISFPLIGELRAAGRTLAELKQEVVEKISVYVPDPTLSAEVKQVNSMLIYIIGRVNQPNRFVINTNITVLQALAMAGGLNPFAKRGSIKVFRQEGDKTKLFPFHYDDVIEGKRLEENITLKRGDIVVVP